MSKSKSILHLKNRLCHCCNEVVEKIFSKLLFLANNNKLIEHFQAHNHKQQSKYSALDLNFNP